MNNWPKDYFASRGQFIDLALACGARTQSYPLQARGPVGESLTVDVAALTSTHDKHRVVLTSGVHGVEGFIGAAVQAEVLRWLALNGIPDRTGIVMIHAVNPWGFAHLRRVDDSNVDINRNFFDFTTARPASHPQYASLDPLINPRQAPSVRGELRYWWGAGRLIFRHRGIAPLSKPIAQGQYDFPQGVFFGGVTVSESCSLLQKLILGVAADADRLTLLDIHSGLGPPAVATLIVNDTTRPPKRCVSELGAHYNQTVQLDNDSSNAYNAEGTFARWCQSKLSHKRAVYLCVEIGTVNPIRLFSALRRENQACHWTASDSPTRLQTRQALCDVFAPASRSWRAKATAQGLQVFEKTIQLPAA